MAGSSTGNIALISKDRISALPLHIQEIILCFLPIQDAVRTSVLSTKWRYCWTTIPNLIFDNQFSILNELNRYRGEEVKAIKYVSVVNKLLILHKGPIHKFSLMFPIGCDAQVVHEFIDHWIPLFSRHGTKKLIIEDYNERGEFKAHNFSSLDLTHLRLTRALFPYTPVFGGYSTLINLELVRVTYDLELGIFDCPALEKLTLIFCNGIFLNNFRVPNLRCLHQVWDQIDLEYDLATLENLTEFSYVLVSKPVMQTDSSNVVKVLDSVQKIEKFSTGRDFLKYLAAGGCPSRLSQPLPYLKALNIWDMNFADLSEVSCLLCLIRSAPNLSKLHISHYECFHEEGCECAGEEDLKKYCIEYSEGCTFDHLEIVTFSNFMGLKAELELVKFLLGHSPLLKQMYIHRDERIREDVAKEIMQYSRASSRAQIRDLEHPVTIDEFDFELWLEMFEL